MPNYVPGCGPFNPDLMIIGEAPGRLEDEQLTPFVGQTGSELDSHLYSAGISRSEVYITNVVKYRPPMNKLSQLHLIGVDLEHQINELWKNEIEVLKPKCILAVGDTALEAVTGKSGILKYRGSILLAKDGKTKVVPTIHPAALFSRFSEGDSKGGLDYVYNRLIRHDIHRAVNESKTSILELPDRELQVIHDSLQLFRFFRQYHNLHKCSVDIESINCVPVSISFAFNSHHAISVPLFTKLGEVKLTDMSDGESDECWRIIDEQLRRVSCIGQNFKYDDFKLSLIGFRCPQVISDTLIKTRVIFPELPSKKLEVQTSLWTREPYYKDEGSTFKLGKSSISQLLLYNAKDAAVTFEIDEAQDKSLDELSDIYKVPLRSYYYDYMMRKHKFYLRMENVGFRIDHEVKAELRARYSALQKFTHEKLTELVGDDVNVKSYPQIYQLLYRQLKFKPYVKDPTSEDSIVKLIATHCKGKDGAVKKGILETILEERRIRDQKSRNIDFTPDYDGRCKSSFNVSATETCRSSTSVLKKPVRPKKIGLAFHTISKHGRLAKDIRSMFIPDKGKVFIQIDASQCQARIVAVLAEDWELLKAFDSVDIHRRTAGLIFGLINHLNLKEGFIPKVDEIDKESAERFCGKKTRHAGNFDMGKRRFMTEVNTDAQKFGINLTISEWKAGQMLDLFHAASPKLKSKFHADIKYCIDSSRSLIDPFGGVRIFNGRMDDELYKEAYANIPQRTEAHVVQKAALDSSDEFGDADVQWISENHDSLLIQCPENDWECYAKVVRDNMQRPIDFGTYCSLKRDYQLVIPADVEISDKSWADMRRVKV